VLQLWTPGPLFEGLPQQARRKAAAVERERKGQKMTTATCQSILISFSKSTLLKAFILENKNGGQNMNKKTTGPLVTRDQ
jgi:hypothetical protein